MVIWQYVFFTGVTEGTEVFVTNADIISISKKLTMLEMKELNERQRAEHAVRMYEQQRHLLGDLESRNKELEDKFAEVCVCVCVYLEGRRGGELFSVCTK